MSVYTYYNWTADQYRPVKLQLQLILLLYCVSQQLEMYINVSLYLLQLNSWPIPTSIATVTPTHTYVLASTCMFCLQWQPAVPDHKHAARSATSRSNQLLCVRPRRVSPFYKTVFFYLATIGHRFLLDPLPFYRSPILPVAHTSCCAGLLCTWQWTFLVHICWLVVELLAFPEALCCMQFACLLFVLEIRAAFGLCFVCCTGLCSQSVSLRHFAQPTARWNRYKLCVISPYNCTCRPPHYKILRAFWDETYACAQLMHHASSTIALPTTQCWNEDRYFESVSGKAVIQRWRNFEKLMAGCLWRHAV